ncbi:MAG: polysaccharide deacetylase family protein [Chloroflexi bacterium]|nr:polysaccharide deacetylase family protein [Chloroflexota bacterium]
MKKLIIILGIVMLLSACTLRAPSSSQRETLIPFEANPTIEYTATLTEPVPTFIFTSTATNSQTATLTPTISVTPTPIFTPTPTLVFIPAGELVAPILLYYRVDESDLASRFYVSPENFRKQMAYLKDQGYTSITISEFTLVLINGGELPAKPVLITFDDSDASIYENAFPIMQDMGYVGVVYLTGNRLYSDGFLSPEQLNEITAAGWQVGSQGMTHQDLTTLPEENLRYELLQSRVDLEDILGVRVTTFAYPFGTMSGTIANKLQEFGYYSAAGLGESSKHTWGSIYYLSRIEVQGIITLDDFATLLP